MILKYEKKRIAFRKNVTIVQIKTVLIQIMIMIRIKEKSLIQGRLEVASVVLRAVPTIQLAVLVQVGVAATTEDGATVVKEVEVQLSTVAEIVDAVLAVMQSTGDNAA